MTKELDLLFGVICPDCHKLITVYVRGTPRDATAKVIHGGKVCEPAPLRTSGGVGIEGEVCRVKITVPEGCLVSNDNRGIMYPVGETTAFLTALEMRALRRIPGVKVRVLRCVEREFEVWSEGFAATGERGGAHLLGTASAYTFREACSKVAETLSDPGLYDSESLTYWACKLFDNVADARRSFG